MKNIESYWVRVRAVGACSRFQIEQYAILSYATTGSSLSLSIPPVFPQYTNDFGRKAVRQLIKNTILKTLFLFLCFPFDSCLTMHKQFAATKMMKNIV